MRRAVLGVAVALALWTVSPASVAARPLVQEAAAADGSRQVAMSACSDGAYNLLGPRWKSTLHWRYRPANAPGGLGQAAIANALKRSFTNMTGARNDCGLPDNVNATSAYDGTTSRAIGVTAAGRCGSSDGRNTIGWGSLPFGILAVICTRSSGNEMVEADVRMSTNFSWATSVASCSNDELIEATMTHEIGHAFGLGHVGEKKHGRLTMSTRSDGPCNNNESSLGLGDVLGLEDLY